MEEDHDHTEKAGAKKAPARIETVKRSAKKETYASAASLGFFPSCQKTPILR
jgi:hypothetical protein